MHSVRRLVLLLVLSYAALTLGLFYHSHAAGPQHAVKCQICQYSQMDQDQVVAAETRMEDQECGPRTPEILITSILETEVSLSKRAPPIN